MHRVLLYPLICTVGMIFLLPYPSICAIGMKYVFFSFLHKIDEYNNKKCTYGFIRAWFLLICFLYTNDLLKLTVCVWHRIWHSVLEYNRAAYGLFRINIWPFHYLSENLPRILPAWILKHKLFRSLKGVMVVRGQFINEFINYFFHLS